jgi:phage terminase large subunit
MRKRLTLQAIEACEQKVANADGLYHSTVFGIVHPNGKLLRCIECVNGEWIEVDKPADIYTAEKLERAVTSKKRFVIIIGGRGSMKSVGVVDIMLAGVQDYGDKVYCLREYQSSISESVHALNKGEIERLGLEGFGILDTTIRHKNGGELKYLGLSRNPESIKSAAGFRRFFSEESAKLSESSLTNLTPTARNKAKAGLPNQQQEEKKTAIDDVQMYFVANPNSSNDPFSKRFIVPFQAQLDKHGYYEDDLHLIIKMNYTDNPWFADSGLEQERAFDYANKSRAKYDHIWLGAFLDDIDNSIIEAEWFDACVDAHIKLNFAPLGQEKIAYDPADSGDAKAMAYQHGSVVLGVTSTTANDINDATDWALGHVNKLKPDVFLWDSDGVGLSLRRQITDGVKGKKIKLVPFHGGGSVDNQFEIYDEIGSDFAGDIDKERNNAEMFINSRAQCYWILRDRMLKTYLMIEKGKHFPTDELISFSSGISELAGLRAEICRIPRKYNNASGRIQIMSKPEMKKLGIQSPNMADAVMMLQKQVDIYEPEYQDYTPRQSTGNWA